MMPPMRSIRPRRGGVYILVLGTCALVATVALGAVLASRAQARAADEMGDAAEARAYAQSVMELGRLWIAQDPDWRANRPNGAWITNQAFGGGRFSLSVTDPADGNLANQPHDPVVMTATGTRGRARQMIEVTLKADPVPLPALRYAAHTAGQFHVRTGRLVISDGSTVSTDGSVRNDGIITGSVEAGSASTVGAVWGRTTLGIAARGVPNPAIIEKYAAIGTLINPGSTIDRRVLAPGLNPWGATNPAGVYVIRSSGDVMIRNSRIHGTLVIICPGRKVVVDSEVLLHPASPAYPALLVDGNLELQFTGGDGLLSEAAESLNFNPTSAPYNGMSDGDAADVYPSEIRGLVHATGTVLIGQTIRVVGAVIANSTAAFDAIDINANAELLHEPSLVTTPPLWYTQKVRMVPIKGSLRQVVE